MTFPARMRGGGQPFYPPLELLAASPRPVDLAILRTVPNPRLGSRIVPEQAAPLDLDRVRVERALALRMDLDALDQRGHDGALAVQAQARPDAPQGARDAGRDPTGCQAVDGLLMAVALGLALGYLAVQGGC